MANIEIATVPKPVLDAAALIYEFAPEIQSWNGDPYAFHEVLTWQSGWGEGRYLNQAARAIKQAEAVLSSLETE